MFLQGENKAKRLELVCTAIDLIVWQIAGTSVAMGPGVTSHALVPIFIVTIIFLYFLGGPNIRVHTRRSLLFEPCRFLFFLFPSFPILIFCICIYVCTYVHVCIALTIGEERLRIVSIVKTNAARYICVHVPHLRRRKFPNDISGLRKTSGLVTSNLGKREVCILRHGQLYFMYGTCIN